MKKEFEEWLKINNKPERYSRTILTIIKDLKSINYQDYNLYNNTEISSLKKIMNDYFSINKFYSKNKRGNSMYSSAFNRYLEFISYSNTNKCSILNDIEEYLHFNLKTESKNLISSRLGQGVFREKLINYWGKCPVTNILNTELLVASHIKPWSLAEDNERLDPFNGILLSPNIDKLFDKGYISFSNLGEIIISIELEEYEKFGINKDIKILFHEKHFRYLAFHRDYIFKK